MKTMIKSMLFASAAVVALNAAADTAAVSQGPTLSFGGSATGYGVAANQKVRLQGNAPTTNFVSKGNLVMSVSGNASNGMGYGAVGVVNFDRAKTQMDRISELYIYANHDMLGSLKLGDTEGVTSVMMYTGDDTLGGLGGTSGDLAKLINVTRGVDFYPSITPANDKATKIVWLSPEYKGFQIGVDFTPSTKLYGREERGTKLSGGNVKNNSVKPYSTNLVAGGISYNQAFQNCNLGLYLVGQTGNSRNDNAANVGASTAKFSKSKGWQAGTLVDYKNFQIAASYFDNKKSLVRYNGTNTGNHTNTKGMNAGIGYDFARNANIGVGYTHAYRTVTGGKAKADIATLTLDYVVAPGWVAFAEVDHFKLRAPAATISTTSGPATDGSDIYGDRDALNGNNHGTLVVLGTKVRF